MLGDVLDGFTSVELAERDYGVVIDASTMTVDQGATAERRSARATLAQKA